MGYPENISLFAAILTFYATRRRTKYRSPTRTFNTTAFLYYILAVSPIIVSQQEMI